VRVEKDKIYPHRKEAKSKVNNKMQINKRKKEMISK
jgi:hypothetical protein